MIICIFHWYFCALLIFFIITICESSSFFMLHSIIDFILYLLNLLCIIIISFLGLNLKRELEHLIFLGKILFCYQGN